MKIEQAALERLRERVGEVLSQKRAAHTFGVEREIAQMAQIYAPQQAEMLRAAALLHDITKEYDTAQTEAVLRREGIVLREDECASVQILHAITAPAEIRRLYPDFAEEMLLSCVRWHTTGRAGITLCEALLYLADVIEPGRSYPGCVALRRYFWQADPHTMTKQAREQHLIACVLHSLLFVRESLLKKQAPVCRDTLEAIVDLEKRKTF